MSEARATRYYEQHHQRIIDLVDALEHGMVTVDEALAVIKSGLIR